MEYDVIVVGAGHAGCEAALAAARLGAKTLLLTISLDTIAAMSCNPAIGGPAAKSHLVRELDALGGEMGKVIDRTYMNIRRLNETRGPAVLALRAQADKRLYQAEMTLRLERQADLFVKQGLVTELLVEDGRTVGVRLRSGREYHGQTVVLTTGTFLGGMIVMGQVRYSGGRQGEPAATELSTGLQSNGLKLRRFQTATPPRILRRSVDFSKLQPQPLQEPEWGFSWDGLPGRREQDPCWFTMTTPQTIQVIRDNLATSPIRSGSVTGKGPHFCPSIDRKVINFPEKTDHLIFLEPEGQYTEELYLLGLTTAMPETVQEQILATVPGLERAEIVRPGYAVEYDCLESHQFDASLESKIIANLFTAGQINGTSGYEEAAAQGLVAGVNAVRKLRGQEPYIPERFSSYIGVMIDDLVTNGTDEPYRMMTSLAEYRLFLRLDNSLARLGATGHNLGLVTGERWDHFTKLLEDVAALQQWAAATKVKAEAKLWDRCGLTRPDRGFRLSELMLRPDIPIETIREEFPEITKYPGPAREEHLNELRLAGYFKRQEAQLEEARQLEKCLLTADIANGSLPGLSENAREALKRVRPRNLGQALRINGLSPADRALIILHSKKAE